MLSFILLKINASDSKIKLKKVCQIRFLFGTISKIVIAPIAIVKQTTANQKNRKYLNVSPIIILINFFKVEIYYKEGLSFCQ